MSGGPGVPTVDLAGPAGVDYLAMYHQGYLLLRGLVPRQAAEAIRQLVDADPSVIADDPVLRADSYCPALREHPLLLGVANAAPLRAVADALLGAGNTLPVSRVQVALRHPGNPGDASKTGIGHVDGLGTGINGIPGGAYQRGFSLVAVLLLSDCPRQDMGNFFVHPGSHRRAGDYLALRGQRFTGAGLAAFPRAEPLIAAAGDVVFTNPLCVHGAAANRSSSLRYAVVIRFKHRDRCHAVDGDPSLLATLDPWQGWDGLRAAIGEAAGAKR